MGGFLWGIIKGDLFKTKSLHKTVQKHTDGAFARYYTISEWSFLVSRYFNLRDIRIYGSKEELIPLPGGRVKDVVMNIIPDGLTRFLTNSCKMGAFLVSILEKK